MDHFLAPILALIIWTLMMWVWMYIKRLPAMSKIDKNPQSFIDDPTLWDKIEVRAKWAAENYNHLHEQPVLFYALMLFLYAVDATSGYALGVAWAYVIIRIIHSLVQVTINKVIIRFTLFVASTLCLSFLAGIGVGALIAQSL